MLIDWFTVGAQALNFLVLVWLLKRFLYKPVLAAIDARERRIAGELADAAATRTAAEKERAELASKNHALDLQRGALLAQATGEARAERERLLAAARDEVGKLREKQANAMRSDQARLRQEITRLATQEVFAIARKTLGDLAMASLEERMGEVFTRRLRELDKEAKSALAAALASGSEASVRSTFDVPAGQRASIQRALSETFAAEVRIRFETSPDGICGIELTAGGQKVAWSIAEYLAELEQKVKSLLGAKAEPAAEAATATTP
jgi:F-type H+-transporting ATPase subunit b